eukprot:653917-Hanusia_phi.AAC.2
MLREQARASPKAYRAVPGSTMESLPLKEMKRKPANSSSYKNKEQRKLKRKIKKVKKELPTWEGRGERTRNERGRGRGSRRSGEHLMQLRQALERCNEQDRANLRQVCSTKQTRLGTIGSKESQLAIGKTATYSPQAPLLSSVATTWQRGIPTACV